VNVGAGTASCADDRPTMPGQLEAAAEAFGALTEGEPAPLIELLAPDVEWIEHAASRARRTLRGAELVARVVAERTQARRPALVGIAKVDSATLEVGFAEPWWLDRPAGLRARIAAALFGHPHQVATLEGRIVRIESYTTLFAQRLAQGGDVLRHR
jgi:hypothetical protein